MLKKYDRISDESTNNKRQPPVCYIIKIHKREVVRMKTYEIITLLYLGWSFLPTLLMVLSLCL